MELKEMSSEDEGMEIDEVEVPQIQSSPQKDTEQEKCTTQEETVPVIQTVDLSQFAELIEKLESSSNHKLLTVVVNNAKELCKLAPYQPQTILSVSQRVDKFCAKCVSNSEKRDKFYRKISPSFSCEEGLFLTFIKYGMKAVERYEEVGASLISIIRSLLSVAGSEGKVTNPLLGINFMVNHSKAREIFLEHLTPKGKPKVTIEQSSGDIKEEFKTNKTSKQEKKRGGGLSSVKKELLKLWRTLVESFCKISKLSGTKEDKKMLEDSIPYLMNMYGASLGANDRLIFSILKLYTSKKLQIPLETVPLFGPKSLEEQPLRSSPLYAHSIRPNTVLGLLNDVKAFETGMKFHEKLDVEDETRDLEEYYDIRFILPLVCHCLDERNKCDVVKVMTNGWIYFIMRGMALEDNVLRNVAFLSYKRLVFSLLSEKAFRLQDIKVWLHFLEGVKKGFRGLEELRLSNLLAVWLVATCEVLKSPAHLMYSRVTHFLLAKPTIDLTILPDFIPFFNAVDGNKESREWILNVLVRGLQNKADWTVARKVPTVKFLCCAFSLEKIGTQRVILNILANGAKIPEVAHDMVDRHALLLWISNVPLGEKLMYRRELEDIYKNLSRSCPQGHHRNTLFKFVASKHNWEYVREHQDNQLILHSNTLPNESSEPVETLIMDDLDK